LNNEIKSEECSAALKTGMENVQKQLHFYHSNLMLLHILALFLAWSYCCYGIASEIGLSPRSRTAVVFGPLLVSVLYICVAYPLVTTLAGGAGTLVVLVMNAACCIQTGLLIPVLLIRMILFTTPSEDEEEKQRCGDSEDGYRRMGDDETVLYVAVPLQVV
jgi:hypothetical protein